jgi:DNA-binding ferritin-like protein
MAKMKTMKNRTKKNLTRKNVKMNNFQKEVTIMFLEMLMLIKLFHWKTYSYSTHKATDELYSSLNEHMDNFIEILMGKTGLRTNLMKQKQIKLMDLGNSQQLKQKIDEFKSYLVSFDQYNGVNGMSNSDLLNIRDEILADMNKFLYLLSLK